MARGAREGMKGRRAGIEAGLAGRTRRVVLLVSLLGGCAASPVTAPALGEGPELSRLRAELRERDATVAQLEGRLALLEAEQRELRHRLAQQPDGATRESVRIGRATTEAEREPAAPIEVHAPATEGPRPLLRLHNERRAGSASWSPSQRELSLSSREGEHERLSVAAVPALPSPGERPLVTPSAVASEPGQRKAASREPAPLRDESAAADARYRRARELAEQRESGEALREFDGFLREFPEDGRVARAHFTRGELLFAEREYARALVAFELALQREPAGEQAAHSLLQIARCQFRLGASERGKASITQLKARFPDSAAARRAEQVMQEDT